LNVLITINNSFARQAVVLIKSLAVHHRHLSVYVLYCELGEKEQLLLKGFCEFSGIEVAFVRADSSALTGLRTAAPFPAEVYLRLFSHIFLPQSVEKILYLDTDIICNGNLDGLYENDLGEHCLLACARDDLFCSENFVKTHWNEKDALRGKYFNSGVLLLHCKKMRELYPSADSLRENVCAAGERYLFDQGLLNYIFARDAILIPGNVYNYRYGFYYLKAPEVTEKYSMSDARLIHYSGEITPYKPWDLCFGDDEIEKYEGVYGGENGSAYFVVNRKINDIAKIWWEYAIETSVYDELLLEMKVKKEWFKRGISGFLKRLSVL